MGLFDKAKKLAGQHADKVGDGIDKAADMADRKTGGKHSDQIDKGAEAAKGFVDDDGGRAVVHDAEGNTPPPAVP